MKNLVRVVLAAVVFAAAVLGGFFALAHAGNKPVAHVAAVKAIPAPTTAAGYTKMFAALPTDQWGAADVSLSVPLKDGRAVWLYGDTFSGAYGMVHSTAIVQDGGRLHISNRGMQLLPDDPNGNVYWIETAQAGAKADTVLVQAEQVRLGAANGLDFHRANAKDRQALLKVDAAGNVHFEHWTGWVKAPKIDQRFLTVKDGAPYQKMGDLFYRRLAHPEARLAGGKTLYTVCHNHTKPVTTADGQIDYAAYRPVFSEK